MGLSILPTAFERRAENGWEAEVAGSHGHGSQGPSYDFFSCGVHPCGVEALSCGPGRHLGPRSVAGIGSRDHVLPDGWVPVLTCSGVMGIRLPSGSSSADLPATKSKGCVWKQASDRFEAGHSR